MIRASARRLVVALSVVGLVTGALPAGALGSRTGTPAAIASPRTVESAGAAVAATIAAKRAAASPPAVAVSPQRREARVPLIKPGEILVRFAADAPPTRRATALLRAGARKLDRSAGGLARVAVAAGRERAAAARLSRDPAVVYAEPNYLRVAASHVDADDVYRFSLREGETLRAALSRVDRDREYVELLLHGPRARDVTDLGQVPLREDGDAAFNPLRLRHTAGSDGSRYLDVFGVGTYRLRWSILSPRMVYDVDAVPSTFTPDDDGRRDHTKISWRLRRLGRVTLRIRAAGGAVVRRVDYGVEPAGRRAFRWNGRNDAGRLVPVGRYRATVAWADGRGRVASRSTRVRLDR